mgnify:CR=1 FL=1
MSKTKIKYVSKWVGKILHIYDFTYRQNYYFIFAKTHKEYRDICKRQLKNNIQPKENETGGGFNVFTHGKDKTKVCYIWAFLKRNIIHECMHAISYVLRHRGIPLNDDTEEAYAYSLGFLTEEIFDNWKNSRVKADRKKGRKVER